LKVDVLVNCTTNGAHPEVTEAEKSAVKADGSPPMLLPAFELTYVNNSRDTNSIILFIGNYS
jgi:hypothetical protein